MVRGGRKEMLCTVGRAIDGGINYFDTARIYGDEKSESNLGAVLEELKADVMVGTKVRLDAPNMERITEAVIESVEGSLRRLRRDCVDLIQLHNPIGIHRQPGRGWLGVDDLESVILAFQSLQEQGKARFWGINGLGETKALLQAVDSGSAYTIQACYNLINPSAGNTVPPEFPFQDYRRLIDKASTRQIGVIAIRVLAGGALSGTTQRHPNADQTVSPIASGDEYADDVKRAKTFQFLVEQGYAGSLVEAAIRFAITHSGISTALVGFSSLEQLDRAIGYAAEGPLPPEALRQIEEAWTLQSEQ